MINIKKILAIFLLGVCVAPVWASTDWMNQEGVYILKDFNCGETYYEPIISDTVVISNATTTVIVTDPEQFAIRDEQGEPTGRYYSVYVTDGASLIIADGVHMRCHTFRLGCKFPEESKNSAGAYYEGMRPGYIVFKDDSNVFDNEAIYYSNCIFTGCGTDVSSDIEPHNFIFFYNGIVKHSQFTFHAQHTFFAPCKINWPELGYNSDVIFRKNDQWEGFWNLNNVNFHLARYWRHDKFLKESINAQMNYDSLSGIMYQNNENESPYPTVHWTGDSSIFQSYILNINNWRDSLGRDLNSRELPWGRMALESRSASGTELSWNLCGSFNEYNFWSSSYVGIEIDACKGIEVCDSFTFTKDNLVDGKGIVIDSSDQEFIGSWIVGGNNVTNTVAFERLLLRGDCFMYIGRKISDTDGDRFTNNGYINTTLVLNSELVGGSYMPDFYKYDNGTLIINHDSTNFVGNVFLSEGLFEVAQGKTFSCVDFTIMPNSGSRNLNPGYEANVRTVNSVLSMTNGSTLDVKNFKWKYIPEVYTSAQNGRYIEVEPGTHKIAFCNSTLKLSGNGDSIDLPMDMISIDVGDEAVEDSWMGIDIANANATYTIDAKFNGDATIRKVGEGTLVVGTKAVFSPEMKFECQNGMMDFGGRNMGDKVSGNGLVQNGTFSVSVLNPQTEDGPIYGDNCVIDSVAIYCNSIRDIVEKPICLSKSTSLSLATSVSTQAISIVENGQVMQGNIFSTEVVQGDDGIYRVYGTYILLPELSANASAQQIMDVLAGASDSALKNNITTIDEYNAFRSWAMSLSGVSVVDVYFSEVSWYSYAFGQTSLLATAPSNIAVETFSFTSGVYVVDVCVDGVTINANASQQNLSKLFGVVGASTIDGEFTEAVVDVETISVAEGKAKIRFMSKDATARQFFIKVKIR